MLNKNKFFSPLPPHSKLQYHKNRLTIFKKILEGKENTIGTSANLAPTGSPALPKSFIELLVESVRSMLMLQLLLCLLCPILVEFLQGFPPEQLVFSSNIINLHFK